MAIDKNFAQQLDSADLDGRSLQAWFQLKADHPDELAPSPERTKELANDLVSRVGKSTGEEPENVQILDQLGSLRVKARPDFIRVLSTQPEVQSARATNTAGYELIRPVKSEPVRLARRGKQPSSHKTVR